MSRELQASDGLPRQFRPAGWELQRWRRAMGRSSARRVFYLLKQIESDQSAQASHGAGCTIWLLKYRPYFRWVFEHGRVEPIKLYLVDCPMEMIPVAVWLWGRLADRFRLYGLSAFCLDPSPKVRRQVAKALRRLEAWMLLNEMAATCPSDAKIQWYATAKTTHRPFAERLRNYQLSVGGSRSPGEGTRSQMPFWTQNSSWERTPPKSASSIRRFLQRIQHWVRWGVS